MSVRFAAAADRLLWTASLLDRDANYSWCAFIRPAALPASGAYATLFSLNDNNPTSGEYDIWDIQNNGTNTRLLIATENAYSETRGTLNLAANTWYFVAGVRSGVTTRTGYVVAIATPLVASDVTHLGSSPSPCTETRLEFGGFATVNADPYDGRIAGIKLWNAALTLAEIQAEQWTIRPRRYANLVRWLPCLNGATERLKDYAGVLNATAGGTLTDEDMPPVAWGAMPPQFSGGAAFAAAKAPPPFQRHTLYQWRTT
jgi:hypothetical protein